MGSLFVCITLGYMLLFLYKGVLIMRNDEETYNEFNVNIGFRVKCVYKNGYNHNVIIGDIVNVNNDSLYITGYDENKNYSR